MKFAAIIPARYASTRFPGKPLALLNNKPIVQWVYERVSNCNIDTFIATDDIRIKQCVENFGGNVIMTSETHKSGTDRIMEAFTKLDDKPDVIINVQGDEPFIDKSQILSIMKCFEHAETQIATLVKAFGRDCSIDTIENPNSPKVVFDNQMNALYFSRSIIPYLRGIEKTEWPKHCKYFKHLGIYAYKATVLKEITQLPQSIMEKAESLEQLRWLENGYKIKVGITDVETVGIDTPQDLKRAEEFLHKSIKDI